MSHQTLLAIGIAISFSTGHSSGQNHAATDLSLPAHFVPNEGQWSHDAAFMARFGTTTAWIEPDGFVLGQSNAETGVALRIRFAQGATVAPEGARPLATSCSYFLGRDASRWRPGVPLYGAIRWNAVWPGVDVIAYETDGHLEYDLELAPGADLAAVRMEIEGADHLELDADGALLVHTGGVHLRQTPPVSWITAPEGDQRPVKVRYLVDEQGFGFAAEDCPAGSALTIDPGLVYGTYLGGPNRDMIHSVHVDPTTGILTVAGTTDSAGFPTTMGTVQPGFGGQRDLFVARIDPSLPGPQQLIAATYLGGSQRDSVAGGPSGGGAEHPMAVLTGTAVAIGGYSSSMDYPVTPNAWRPNLSGSQDGVVTMLDLSLQSILYSTYVGGNGDDEVRRIHLDSNLVLTLAGDTTSTDFLPAAGLNGSPDGFVAQIDTARPAAQQFSPVVRIAGNDRDRIHGLAVAANGSVAFCGASNSIDLPVSANAWQSAPGVCGIGGACRGFFGVADPSLGQPLLYLSYLNSSGTDSLQDIEIDANGVLTVGGTLGLSSGGPELLFGSVSGGTEALIARFDPSLPPAAQLLYLARIGGDGSESIFDIEVDAAGRIVFCGGTGSGTGFPTTAGAFGASPSGQGDGFLGWLDPSLPASQQLLYCTYFGGRGDDVAADLSVQGSLATIVGRTYADVPTTPGAYDTVPTGSTFATGDGFIAQIDMVPLPPPTLAAINPAVVPNYDPVSVPRITLTGTGMLATTRVLLDGQPVRAFSILSDTQLAFDLPQPTTIANGRIVTIEAAGQLSNPVVLDVVGVHPPILEQAPIAARGNGSGQVVHGDAGWWCLWVISTSQTPSSVAGIVTLEIGNNFMDAFEGGTVTLDATGTGRISITYPPTLPIPLTVYGEVITFDPANLVTPLETSEVGVTQVRF